MREYKIAKGWAIFMYVSATLLIVLFSWALMMSFIPSMNEDMNSTAYWFIISISLIMIALMIVGIIETKKSKLVIDKEQVFIVSTFSNRELMFDEIMGYRITDKYIIIESNNEHKKQLKVSKYFENTNEIVVWLSKNYSDLNVVESKQEKEEILNNEEFGWTIEQREEQLIKAHKTAKYLNWIGGIIGAWTIFLANPYEYAMTASIIFPVICVCIIRYFKGLIRTDDKKDSAYPTAFLAIFAPSMGLCIRALLDYNIFDYSNVWIPTILIALAYIAILTIGNKEFKFNKVKDYLRLLGFSIFLFGYSYGAVIALNCIYDQSVPENFNATVLSKRINSGKATTYHLELTSWGYQKEINEVTVPEELYNQLGKNDNVNIYFMKGRFDIPWFIVSE
ncbi:MULTISPECIES: hypothetical protein [unclassified Arcicella]|uniref:hypothetical protein n=1 Tax=unclassified Arcicella TaxID=2644986 RepID=UPI00286722D7|nr:MULTISPECIES: hypothetical protein [unclassified Arcicella]MDR6560446.1 hypothetical protein [Arcicella sp. BE51]MDR6809948.1 hypothetical protein [Arcicella sp. BE140]MDR6821297.1 hypothetical protein [Arcicella sp. BE139]